MGRRDARRERAIAVELFNEVWRLLEKPRRSKADADRMVHAAHASRHHWGEVGTPVNVAIGEWQVSHVYAVLRRAEPATYHAKRCLALCREHGIGDFPLAFAYEALARADALAGRRGDLRRHLAAAERAGRRIAEEADREEFFRQLRALMRRR
ncbi:MAG: hypothetical protein A3K59_08540 [Euryarchaeota archaeon RBG_19FT_COMBO_69_17]|nr:MAG: hypothetical protein A3K59_08540 [Euryarchaeota archaeon RBG_19FT_COMBO_69_17]